MADGVFAAFTTGGKGDAHQVAFPIKSYSIQLSNSKKGTDDSNKNSAFD
jgi:hypothetical protein